jgi:hypothetical protein
MIFSGITIWSYFDAVRADGGSNCVAALANALAVVQFAMLRTLAGCAHESAAGVKLAGVTIGGWGALLAEIICVFIEAVDAWANSSFVDRHWVGNAILVEDAARTDNSTRTHASWWASWCWKEVARVELAGVGKVRCRLGIVFPNGIDSVDGADLHDVAIGALKIKGKAFKAVDADSSGIIDDGIVGWI